MTSENTPARDPELDAKMLAELRTYVEGRKAHGDDYRLAESEVDLLLAIADERDALLETVEAEWPSEYHAISSERERGVCRYCHFGIVRPRGGDWMHTSPEAGVHTATPLETTTGPLPEKIAQPMGAIPVDVVPIGTAYPRHETKREQWPCWICDEAITIRHGARPGTARFRHVEMGEYAHDAVRGPDPIDRRCAGCGFAIVPKKAGTVGVAWETVNSSLTKFAETCDHHPEPKHADVPVVMSTPPVKDRGLEGTRDRTLRCENNACPTDYFKAALLGRCPTCDHLGFRAGVGA